MRVFSLCYFLQGKFESSGKADNNGKVSNFKSDYNDRKPNYDNNGSSSNSKYSSLKKYYPTIEDTIKAKNVVDSMDKLSLKGKTSDVKSSSTTTFPPGTATDTKHNFKSNYPIVGFQNKEANEHAKNVLKTKNITPATQKPAYDNKPAYQQKNHVTSGPAISQALKNQPPPFKSHAPMSSSQPQMHSLPQPFVQHQNNNPVPVMHSMPPVMSVNNSQLYLSMNYQTPAVMQPTNPQFHGKVGEMVMAKYWEDGQVS